MLVWFWIWQGFRPGYFVLTTITLITVADFVLCVIADGTACWFWIIAFHRHPLPTNVIVYFAPPFVN